MPGVPIMPEAQLQQLASDSRNPARAQQLIEDRVPEQMMALLAQHVGGLAAAPQGAAMAPTQRESLLQTLRIVRNLCALGDAVVRQLARAKAVELLSSSASACALLASQPGAPRDAHTHWNADTKH